MHAIEPSCQSQLIIRNYISACAWKVQRIFAKVLSGHRKLDFIISICYEVFYFFFQINNFCRNLFELFFLHVGDELQAPESLLASEPQSNFQCSWLSALSSRRSSRGLFWSFLLLRRTGVVRPRIQLDRIKILHADKGYPGPLDWTGWRVWSPAVDVFPAQAAASQG